MSSEESCASTSGHEILGVESGITAQGNGCSLVLSRRVLRALLCARITSHVRSLSVSCLTPSLDKV